MSAQIMILTTGEVPADESPVKLSTMVSINGHAMWQVHGEAPRDYVNALLDEQQTEARAWLALSLRGMPELQPLPRRHPDTEAPRPQAVADDT